MLWPQVLCIANFSMLSIVLLHTLVPFVADQDVCPLFVRERVCVCVCMFVMYEEAVQFLYRALVYVKIGIVHRNLLS